VKHCVVTVTCLVGLMLHVFYVVTYVITNRTATALVADRSYVTVEHMVRLSSVCCLSREYL